MTETGNRSTLDTRGTRLTTCTTAGPMMITERDGRILRSEPMQFDPADVVSWQIDVNGKTYKPPLNHPILQWGFATKQMVYSDTRVKYPYKRVDWDPYGERNAEKRGVSGYERISWDEALDLIEHEYRRILNESGSSAVAYTTSAHAEWGCLHFPFSDFYRFRDLMGGSFIEFTPNSWEGWAAGGPFLWGFWQGHGLPPAPDSLQDISHNTELVVLWGNDPLMHTMYCGIDTGQMWKYWKDLGKTIIVIDPLYNETALYAADKWIPIYPGTDAAMAAAIAYQWVQDGTYDQDYLDTHCIGFDEDHLPEGTRPGLSFKSYLIGEGPDDVPKTPEWAEDICGVPARTIRALAKDWGSRPTSLFGMTSGACRRNFAHELARMLGTLMAMQGIGKPGVNILGSFLSVSGQYDDRQVGPTGYADGGMNLVLEHYYPNPCAHQKITFTKWLDCIKEPPQTWQGGHQDNFNADMFFEQVEYPAKGCSEVRMLIQRGSTLTHPPDNKRQVMANTDPKLETFIVFAPWFDRDCRYADIVLPVTSVFEHQELSEPGEVGQYVPPAYVNLRSAIFSHRIIEPVGESKTDIDILTGIAERLGVAEQWIEGNTEDTLLEKLYNQSDIPLTFDEFKDKGYYVWPALPDYQPKKQFGDFYRDPDNNPLETPTGKIEIFSTLIADFYGDDNPEIPVVPHYIPEKEGRFSEERRRDYPLQQLMAHPKFRFHGKYDDLSWLTVNYKVEGPDGYGYEPVYLTPADAAARGLQEGDIARCFNDRGDTLAGVRITSRLPEGVAWLSYGACNYPLSPEPGALDRSGDGNVLSNPGGQSCHWMGGAFNSTLFEVEKADLAALQERYPEGFAGKWSTWNREG